ncbi:MAG TPA: ABC transporter substrate-binding protein [Chloroflexota bacterium]|nr:ABC transporter substrate-binding protein [Chloroflexota bacterium]
MRALSSALIGLIVALWAAACGPAAAPAGERAAPAPAASGAAAPTAAPAARPSAPLEKLQVPFASMSAVYTPFLIAMDKGYFAEDGLEIEMMHVGGGVATPALISGEIQYSTSAATSVSAILKGAPLKVIYTNADRAGYDLWTSAPDIYTLRDLVGKSVGVQSRGDTMEIAARMVLQQNGIDHNAVNYVAMGVGSQRLVALQNGTIPAAVLGTSDTVEMQEAGISGRILANLRKEVQMLYTGLATSDQELRERPDRVRRFLRATIKGREYYKAFREESIDILTKFNDRPREANVVDYDDVLPAMPADASMPVEVQQRDTLLRAEVNGVAPVPVEQIYDYGPVREVYREVLASGWKPAR